MKKQRKHYTPEEKVAILRRHLLDKEPISKLCDELGPTAHGLLPLAEGVLRERGGCVSAESRAQSSTSAELSITCAAFWTAVADTSSTGIYGSR
jgi:transposase-like protein